jgi:hypothetical protein
MKTSASLHIHPQRYQKLQRSCSHGSRSRPMASITLFSCRHRRALAEGQLDVRVSERLRGRIIRLLHRFNACWYYQPDPNDNWMEQTNALSELRGDLLDVYGTEELTTQVEALEAGVEPELVSARIAELKADKAIYEAGLAEIPVEQETPRPTSSLNASPASPTSPRISPTPRARSSVRPSRRSTSRSHSTKAQAASRSPHGHGGRAQAVENTKALQAEGFQVTFSDSGGGIRTRDLRVMSPTSYQTAPPRGVDEAV